jgi:hypothetical protein
MDNVRSAVLQGRTSSWSHVARRWGAVAAIGALAASVYTVAGAGSALAASGKNPAPGVPASAPAAGKTAPVDLGGSFSSKVTVVNSGSLTATTGIQTRGSVACPSTFPQPSSGGALITSSDLNANINSSFPSGSTWIADINNASGTDTTFTVYAVCAKPNFKYTVASVAVTNLNGTQSSGTAVCPLHTFVRGGGALSNSGSTGANINTSIASGTTGWRVDMNNAGGFDSSFTVYAVCGAKPLGYTVVSGTTVTNSAFTENLATVACPSTSPVVLGGGGFSGSGSTAVNMNSTLPTSSGWEVFENNNTASATTLFAQVVCVS